MNELLWRLPKFIHNVIHRLTGWVMVEVKTFHDCKIQEISMTPNGEEVGIEAKRVTTDHIWDRSGDYHPKHKFDE